MISFYIYFVFNPLQPIGFTKTFSWHPRSLNDLQLQDGSGDSKQAESQATKIEEIDKAEKVSSSKEKEDNGKAADK